MNQPLILEVSGIWEFLNSDGNTLKFDRSDDEGSVVPGKRELCVLRINCIKRIA